MGNKLSHGFMFAVILLPRVQASVEPQVQQNFFRRSTPPSLPPPSPHLQPNLPSEAPKP